MYARCFPGMCVVAVLSGHTASACADPPAAGEPVAVGAYPLDSMPRKLTRGEDARCYPDGLRSYAGEVVRYSAPALVHPAFVASLREFERLAADTAEEFYGRAPREVIQLGAYRCRKESSSRRLLSEHALGNALDVAGFVFGPLPAAEQLPQDAPEALRKGFEVRLDRHWNARGDDAVHRRFLRALAERVIARGDMFRVVLGPAYPGHRDHLHLDNAPYHMAEVFER